MHRTLIIAGASLTWLVPTCAMAQAKGTAVFAGTVVDSVQHPIANAEVSLPGMSITRATDDKGNFRLTDIPPGPQRISIRRIGFGQLDTVIVFAENQTIERRVTLGRIVLLDSIIVAAARPDPMLAEFEANRARGFGRFITRAELEKLEGQSLGTLLQQLQGVSLVRGSAGQSWVMGKRGPTSRCPPARAGRTLSDAIAAQRAVDDCLRSEHVYYVPEDYEARQGMKRACYAMVYLDRALMNSGNPTTPFDVNSFSIMQLQGVEWYEGSAGVPATYGSNNVRCGLLILHTRRSG